MNKKFLLLLATLLLYTSCTDFLEELPDNRAKVNSAADIKGLLVNAYNNAQYALIAESMSDNAEDIGTQTLPFLSPSIVAINDFSYRWQDFTSETSNESSTFFGLMVIMLLLTPIRLWHQSKNLITTHRSLKN